MHNFGVRLAQRIAPAAPFNTVSAAITQTISEARATNPHVLQNSLPSQPARRVELVFVHSCRYLLVPVLSLVLWEKCVCPLNCLFDFLRGGGVIFAVLLAGTTVATQLSVFSASTIQTSAALGISQASIGWGIGCWQNVRGAFKSRCLTWTLETVLMKICLAQGFRLVLSSSPRRLICEGSRKGGQSCLDTDFAILFPFRVRVDILCPFRIQASCLMRRVVATPQVCILDGNKYSAMCREAGGQQMRILSECEVTSCLFLRHKKLSVEHICLSMFDAGFQKWPSVGQRDDLNACMSCQMKGFLERVACEFCIPACSGSAAF